MPRRTTAILIAGILAALLGCQSGDKTPAGAKLTVAVTTIPQAWLVGLVGGEHVAVLTLVQPGESHETYSPSDAQISRLMQAKAYFRVGVAAEHGPWFKAIRDSGKLKIVDLRQNVPLLEMTEHDHHGHDEHHEAEESHEADEEAFAGKDPHIWLSPRALKIQAQTVADTLAQLDPAHKADYQRNLAALDGQLDQLDAQIRKMLAPMRGKAFFVYHPAWGYFAEAYGLRQIALEQEGKEPSDQELTHLQQLAKKEDIKVIFVQPQIAGQSAQAVATAIHGRVQEIDPLDPNVPANLLHAAQAIAGSGE
ncbi:MAG: zinc ABC transporter substrate-binding protein [Thermoguttaceae bacterium]